MRQFLVIAAFCALTVLWNADSTDALFGWMPPPRRRFGFRNRNQGAPDPGMIPPIRFPPGEFGIKLPALDPNRIVRFSLYTRENPNEPEFIDTSKVKNNATTRFQYDKPTKVLVHGFVDSASDSTSGEWMIRMKDAYLNTSDANVIIVNYALVSLVLFQWTNLPQVASRRLSSLIYTINKENKVPLESFHLIGRSWGVHVAGMTGYALNGKLGRITALDPASPPVRLMNFDYRLDKSDARFVDVYHLNGKIKLPLFEIFGITRRIVPPMGHVDIYPNFRERQVTGCPMNNASFYTPSCTLGLGARLYLETITKEDKFQVCPCESYAKYIRGECRCETRSYVNMGEHIPMETKGVFQMLSVRIDPTRPPMGQGSRPTIPVIGLPSRPTMKPQEPQPPNDPEIMDLKPPQTTQEPSRPGAQASQPVQTTPQSARPTLPIAGVPRPTRPTNRFTSTYRPDTGSDTVAIEAIPWNKNRPTTTDGVDELDFNSQSFNIVKDARKIGEGESSIPLFQSSVPNLYLTNP